MSESLFVLIGFLPYLLTGTDGEFAEVVEGSVIDVEVDRSVDAGESSVVRMLPELPWSLVLHLLHIVMRYPIRITIK